MSDATIPPSAEVVFDKKYCWGCGTAIHRSAPACPSCGAPQKDVNVNVNAPASPKSRVITIVLALFLGGLGAHKFYLGRPGIGLLYLLFVWTAIPVVVGFIEGIFYILMSDRAFAANVAGGGGSNAQAEAAERPWTPAEGKRPVSPLLVLGIVIMPYLFCWFLLRPGYSTTARVIAFLWAAWMASTMIYALSTSPQ